MKRNRPQANDNIPDDYEARMRRREMRLHGEEIPYPEDQIPVKGKKKRRKMPFRKKFKIGFLVLLLLLILDAVRLMTCYTYD